MSKLSATETAILAYLTQSHEPDEPVTAIMAFLRSIDGKPLTARHLPAIQKIDPTCRIDKSTMGTTRIEWGRYGVNGGRTGGSLLIHYVNESAPRVVNANDIEARNPAYFAARIERNHARMEAQNDRDALRKLANAVDTLKAARATIDAMTDVGQPFDPIRYDIEALAGLRD